MKSVLFKHRSIRKFRPTPIPAEVLRECLEAATRASTCGNMQLYSLVVTRDAALRERLSPCHFNQPMVREAPCVVTVCADVHRFSQWCEQREAEPAYDNFAWFLNAATDALLAAQNLCIEAELHGLGICYLGTTIYTAGEIAQVLELPKGVIPVTTIVMGYPAETPGLTDRLPLEAVVHYEKYTDYTAAEIDELWAEREESDETKRLLEENGLPNLARIFTERRYVRRDNLAISQSYLALLREKGFLTTTDPRAGHRAHTADRRAGPCRLGVQRYAPHPRRTVFLQKIRIEDDKATPRQERIPASELEKYVRQTPNKRFLGTNFYVWLYEQADPAKTNGWNDWKRRIGQAPVLLDMNLTERSVQNLKVYMDSKGFFSSRASCEVDTVSRRKRAILTFRTVQGEPYRIDSISYEFQDKFLEQIILPDTARTLLRTGNVFDVSVLDAERERITAYLRDRGITIFGKQHPLPGRYACRWQQGEPAAGRPPEPGGLRRARACHDGGQHDLPHRPDQHLPGF